jgi:hypothetical protein
MAGARKPKTGGRKKGAPNLLTAQLRDMILSALSARGGQAYLERQAEENPTAFLSLVAKCLPRDMRVESPESIVIRWKGEG